MVPGPLQDDHCACRARWFPDNCRPVLPERVAARAILRAAPRVGAAERCDCAGLGRQHNQLGAVWLVYNPQVDRLDAIRLLRALVAAGANTRAPMASAWIDEIAVRDVSLHGTELASAIAYAEGQRWLADSRTRDDWDLPHSYG